MVLGKDHRRTNEGSVLLKWAVHFAVFATIHREIVGSYELLDTGAFQLWSLDPVIVLSLFGLAQRGSKRQGRLLAWPTALALVMFALTVFNIARGYPEFGSRAIVIARPSAAWLALALFGASVPRSSANAKVITDVMLRGAWVLTGLAWARLLLGPTWLYFGEYTSASEINDNGRALSSQATLAIGFASFISITAIRPVFSRHAAIVPLLRLVVFLLTVSLSKQSTATIATFAGLVVLMVLYPGRSRLMRCAVVTSGAVLALTVKILDLSLPVWLTGDVSRRSGNFETRQEVWDSLMRDFPRWSTVDQFLGLPAGEMPKIFLLRHASYVDWNASVHSAYYGALVHSGRLGLVCYSLLLLATFVWAVISSYKGGGIPVLVAAFIAAIATESVSYEIGVTEAAALCFALLVLRRRAVPARTDPWRANVRTA